MTENDALIEEEEYKKKLLNVFKFFIATCEEYGLEYFCSGGTAIGAVRHNNIIPWDDDIDILMPRNHYEKLLNLQPVLIKKGFNLLSMHNSKYATMMKLYDANTSLWEIKQIPVSYGVFIDIFPLDESNYTKEQFLKKYKYFRTLCRIHQMSNMTYSIKDLLYYFKKKDKNLLLKGIASFFFPSFLSTYLHKRIIAFDNKLKKQKGDYLVSFYGDYYEKEYLNKEWFLRYQEFAFDKFKVRLPIGWHNYLSMVFGDYMKLPPPEKRVTHHYHYYLNLEKHLSVTEIKAAYCSHKN